ncbi:MAG: hypothetical protein Kow0073_16630 [Immundisolibacter sp.]
MRSPVAPDDEAARRQIVMARDIVQKRTFDDRIDDRDHVIDTFERHTRAVQVALPAERLLTGDVAHGWEPLCAFLGVPVPDQPFPARQRPAGAARHPRRALQPDPDRMFKKGSRASFHQLGLSRHPPRGRLRRSNALSCLIGVQTRHGLALTGR